MSPGLDNLSIITLAASGMPATVRILYFCKIVLESNHGKYYHPYSVFQWFNPSFNHLAEEYLKLRT